MVIIMYQELLEKYKEKITIIKNSEYEYDPNNNYYFYSETGEIFSICKNISKKEYLEIRKTYVEKTFHSDDVVEKKLQEYLLEAGPYPFKKHQGKFFILKSTNNEQILDLIKDIYKDIYVFNYCDYEIIFYFENFDNSVLDIFKTMSDDFMINFIVHDGLWFTSDILGVDILTYIKGAIKYIAYDDTIYKYSDASDMVLLLVNKHNDNIIKVVKKLVLKRVLENPKNNNKELLETFFKYDLNVSATAKALYMHRNSLIYRLDMLSYTMGLNIQRFTHAAAILILLNL